MLPGLLLPLNVFDPLPLDEIAIIKIHPTVSMYFLCLLSMTVLHLKSQLFSLSFRRPFLTSKLFPFFPLAPSLLAHFYFIPVTLANNPFSPTRALLKFFSAALALLFLSTPLHRAAVDLCSCDQCSFKSSPTAVFRSRFFFRHHYCHRRCRRRCLVAACILRRLVRLCWSPSTPFPSLLQIGRASCRERV